MAEEYWKTSPFGERSLFHPKASEKELKITYTGCQKDDTYTYLHFDVKGKNLRSSKAQIYVMELEVFNNEIAVPVTNIEIERNTTKKIEVKFKESSLTKSVFEGDFEFEATVACDGLSAKTGEFRIKCVKRKKTDSKEKDEEKVEVRKCFCKMANWTETELKHVITQLRKKEGTGDIQIVRDKNNTKNFAMGEPLRDSNGNIIRKELSIFDSKTNDGNSISDRLFYLKSGENIQSGERNYTSLTKWINYLFKEVKATKCINKIHLLCQIYHETQRLSSTYESDSSAKKSGEDFYRGRGFIMITHDYNYESFYEHLNGKKPTNTELQEFVPKLASSTELAVKSAVWYLNNVNIQNYFNDDNVNNVSAAINYPKALTTKNYDSINGLLERKRFFNLLKEIIGYEECGA